MSTYRIRHGVQGRPIAGQLVDRLGQPIDLTGATVTLSMIGSGQSAFTDFAATVTSPSTGLVSYQPTSGDFAATFARGSRWLARWTVTPAPNGTSGVFPEDEDFAVEFF